jgi:hypothetical protein
MEITPRGRAIRQIAERAGCSPLTVGRVKGKPPGGVTGGTQVPRRGYGARETNGRQAGETNAGDLGSQHII